MHSSEAWQPLWWRQMRWSLSRSTPEWGASHWTIYTPRCICAGAFPIPTAPTSGFVTFWQRDHVIIPRYTGIPTRKWWGKLCLWVSHMSHSDLVSLTFWSSIQLGSAETCASASGQQKGSTSDVSLKVMKLGTGLCNWPVEMTEIDWKTCWHINVILCEYKMLWLYVFLPYL